MKKLGLGYGAVGIALDGPKSIDGYFKADQLTG
jgi:hypothetical protein